MSAGVLGPDNPKNRENKEKYKTFLVPLKKDIIKTDKDGNKTDETISYKIKFIDSTRFMVSYHQIVLII